MSRFIIEFWGVLEDQPGSVVVLEQCQETEIPGSILGGYLQISFFFNLAEKNSFTVKKNSKCRGNGIDRLRNGNLHRRRSSPLAIDFTKLHELYSTRSSCYYRYY